MATKYEKKIQQLMGHVQQLHQLIEERTQQLHYWQGYAKQVRQERQRMADGLLGQVRQLLTELGERYRFLREENQKLLAYAEHRAQLADKTQQGLRSQLQYALSRIDELAIERKQNRTEQAQRYQAIAAERQELVRTRDALATENASLKAQLTDLTTSSTAEREDLSTRLDAAQHQIEIQQEQWQQLVTHRDALASKLEETENALAIAQRTVAEGLGNQQSSIGREVGDLRSLVISLQKQTEALRDEVEGYQEELAKKDRFIALLKEDRSASVRNIGERRGRVAQAPSAPTPISPIGAAPESDAIPEDPEALHG